MRDVTGFVISILGIVFLGLYCARIILPDAYCRAHIVLDWIPGVYWTVFIPLYIAFTFLCGFTLYALLNYGSIPEINSYRFIVDTYGAKSRSVHGDCVFDSVRETPLANDISIFEINKVHLSMMTK